MLYDAIKRVDISGIPRRTEREWNLYTERITPEERQSIIIWINEKFDDVAARRDRVQPSGWLGSGFDWRTSPLMPIYRECATKMVKSDDDEIEAKAGQIFGLFVSIALEERDETWWFVKGEDYKAHGVPIKSRIYFLPDE